MKLSIFFIWGVFLCASLGVKKLSLQKPLAGKENKRERLHIDWNKVRHLKYSDGSYRIVYDWVEDGTIKRVYLR